MKRTFYILILLFCSTQLVAQNEIDVKGILLTVKDSTPIARAHVLDITSKRGVITNEQGEFIFKSEANDSILVSVLGYKTYQTTASEMPDTVYMQERNYQLELYNVIPYKTYQEFKIAFVNLNLKDSTPVINKTIFLSRGELIQAYNEAQVGIIIPGVISSIFAAFDKKAKDKAHVLELIEIDKYETYLATKFNPELVKRITELEDPKKLDDFIEYCAFSKAYLAKNDNYAIITQTFECYEEYLNLPD